MVSVRLEVILEILYEYGEPIRGVKLHKICNTFIEFHKDGRRRDNGEMWYEDFPNYMNKRIIPTGYVQRIEIPAKKVYYALTPEGEKLHLKRKNPKFLERRLKRRLERMIKQCVRWPKAWEEYETKMSDTIRELGKVATKEAFENVSRYFLANALYRDQATGWDHDNLKKFEVFLLKFYTLEECEALINRVTPNAKVLVQKSLGYG